MRCVQRWYHSWQRVWSTARRTACAGYVAVSSIQCAFMTACGVQPSPRHTAPAAASAPARRDLGSNQEPTPPPTRAALQLPEAPPLTCVPHAGPVFELGRTPTEVTLDIKHETPLTWAGVELPLDAPTLSGLPADWVPSAVRTTVITQAGILIALNAANSADSGLYWLKKGEQRPQRIAAVGASDVRWVFSTTFGIIGVEAKCPNACPAKSSVFTLTPTRHYKSWKLKRTAELDGCPRALSLANSDQLFIASACSGTLSRVDRKGAVTIAQWSPEHVPVELRVFSNAGNAGSKATTTLFVNFGNAAAKFTADRTEWYAPDGCSRVVLNATTATAPSPTTRACRCE